MPDLLAQELDPHLGRRVDQQVAAGKANRTLGRVRWFRGSVEVQTEQSQPIMGTPVEVPVPRNDQPARRARRADSLNLCSLPVSGWLNLCSTTSAPPSYDTRPWIATTFLSARRPSKHDCSKLTG